MLNKFKHFLISEKAVKAHYVPYYLKWVGNCYGFLNINDSVLIGSDQKNRFLSQMAQGHEDWQLKQAEAALRPESQNRPRCIRCGTVLPRTFSKTATISGRHRNCWGMRTCRRR